MKKKECLINFAFIFLFLIINISASSLGDFPQNIEITLSQICSNCTQVNLTSVKLPNGTFIYYNDEMSSSNNYDYNISFFQTDLFGEYLYNTCGDPDGIITCENINFNIPNLLGEELTTGKSMTYVLLTFLVFIFFLFILWFNIMIPYQNIKNPRGQIIKIIKLKYLKIMMIPVTHAVFNWFLNLLLSISNNLLGKFVIYQGMITFIFQTSLALAWPLFVICLVWVGIEWIRDLEWNRQIKKFGRVMK